MERSSVMLFTKQCLVVTVNDVITSIISNGRLGLDYEMSEFNPLINFITKVNGLPPVGCSRWTNLK